MAAIDVAQKGKKPGSKEQRAQPAEGRLAQPARFGPSIFSLTPIEVWGSGPFELMRRMAEEMDRMGRGFAPAVDVKEKDGKLVVHAELPGVNADDVHVTATDAGLLIEGERHSEYTETQEGVYRSERSYGSFRRLIPLPDHAELDKAEARLENGVLEVSVPVPEVSRRRQIPISVSGGSGEAARAKSEGVGAGTRTR